MSVILSRAYGGFAAGATVTFPDSTETALIAQGIAVAGPVSSVPGTYGAPFQLETVGGNAWPVTQAGAGAPVLNQGPLNLPCINLGSAALTSYETNGVAVVAGDISLTEIYVPYTQTWTGVGVLNGTTVGTHNVLVALYGTNGALLANSAVAGVVSAGASVFQNVAFTAPITLPPGRYFTAIQFSGVTPTPRHLLAANGSNVCCSTTAGVFGTLPATMTVPSTFTTAVGIISQIYK